MAKIKLCQIQPLSTFVQLQNMFFCYFVLPTLKNLNRFLPTDKHNLTCKIEPVINTIYMQQYLYYRDALSIFSQKQNQHVVLYCGLNRKVLLRRIKTSLTLYFKRFVYTFRLSSRFRCYITVSALVSIQILSKILIKALKALRYTCAGQDKITMDFLLNCVYMLRLYIVYKNTLNGVDIFEVLKTTN